MCWARAGRREGAAVEFQVGGAEGEGPEERGDVIGEAIVEPALRGVRSESKLRQPQGRHRLTGAEHAGLVQQAVVLNAGIARLPWIPRVGTDRTGVNVHGRAEHFTFPWAAKAHHLHRREGGVLAG